MKRRTFVAGLCSAAIWPVCVRAQQAVKLPTIGFMGATASEFAKPWVAAFVKRLAELGWVEGRNVAIDYRWAEARADQYNEIASDFANRKVDVIVTWASAPVLAAKRATATVPIVFAAQMDPVGAGVVASLSRPGGNVTGISIQQTDTAGKRIELLREAAPRLARLAVMANVGAAGAVLEMREVVARGKSVGLDAMAVEIKQADEIFQAVETLRGPADALYIATDPLILSNLVRLIAAAKARGLATISGNRHYAAAGALMTYGPDWEELFRHAAGQVDKILRGAKPADIPVEQPTKFDLVINLGTAKALGLELPPTLLARADEVIE